MSNSQTTTELEQALWQLCICFLIMAIVFVLCRYGGSDAKLLAVWLAGMGALHIASNWK